MPKRSDCSPPLPPLPLTHAGLLALKDEMLDSGTPQTGLALEEAEDTGGSGCRGSPPESALLYRQPVALVCVTALRFRLSSSAAARQSAAPASCTAPCGQPDEALNQSARLSVRLDGVNCGRNALSHTTEEQRRPAQ